MTAREVFLKVVKDCTNANQIIEAMEQYASQDRWVKVSDRLPEVDLECGGYSVYVIATDGVNVAESYVRYSDMFWFVSSQIDMGEIIKWQPLPTAPKD